jgi:hypothetical protein
MKFSSVQELGQASPDRGALDSEGGALSQRHRGDRPTELLAPEHLAHRRQCPCGTAGTVRLLQQRPLVPVGGTTAGEPEDERDDAVVRDLLDRLGAATSAS